MAHNNEFDSAKARIFAQQVDALYHTLPVSLMGSVTMVVMWAFVIAQWLPLTTLFGWGAVMLFQFVFWVTGLHGYRKQIEHTPLSAPEVNYWARRNLILGIISGSLWGLSSLLYFPSTGSVHADYQYLLLLTLAGIISGAALAQSAYLPAVWTFVVPATLPIILKMLLQGIFIQTLFAISAILFTTAVLWFAHVWNAILINGFRLRFQNETLLGEMARQHDIVLEASHAKSKFLAAASHDLRQPLHAITLFLEALKSSNLKPFQEKITEKIGHSTVAMSELLDTLLDISKLDAGVITPEPQAVDLTDLMQQIHGEFSEIALSKNLVLRLRVPPMAATHTDPVLLKSILSNLLSNAIRYTAQGGILLGCRNHQGGWAIDVIDTGMGIPLEKQSEVFKEFVQLRQPHAQDNHGLGLGLAIVERLSRLLDHPLTLRSAPNRGSRFRISVPHIPWTETEKSTPKLLDTSLMTSNALVVVIDDEQAVLDAAKVMLTTWGLRPVCACDAYSAMLALADEPDLPLLIISDFQLGHKLNGIQTIAHIRAEYNAEDDIAALLVTGDIANNDLIAVKASGLTVLHKPVDTEQLKTLLLTLSQPQALVDAR